MFHHLCHSVVCVCACVCVCVRACVMQVMRKTLNVLFIKIAMFHGLILDTFIDVDRIILYYALWAHVRCVCMRVFMFLWV